MSPTENQIRNIVLESIVWPMTMAEPTTHVREICITHTHTCTRTPTHLFNGPLAESVVHIETLVVRTFANDEAAFLRRNWERGFVSEAISKPHSAVKHAVDPDTASAWPQRATTTGHVALSLLQQQPHAYSQCVEFSRPGSWSWQITHTQRQTETDGRQTDTQRQTDGQTDRHTHTETDGQTDRHTQRDRQMEMGGQTDTHTTHTRLTALFRDYPGELVPER